MRIAFLSTGWQSSHGGIQTVNRHLAIALSRQGHEISIIIPQIAANDTQEAAELNIGLEPAGQNFIRALRVLEDFEPRYHLRTFKIHWRGRKHKYLNG
jgi:glycosyltransferase involved in cell wall biosynthesis